MSFRFALGLSVALGFTLASALSAQLNTYSSRAAFEADYPGSMVETFEEGDLGGSDSATFAGPLDSTTNNGVFAPGEIVVGQRYDVAGSGDLTLAGSGYAAFGWNGFPSKVLQPGTNDTDSLTIDVSDAPVFAVGFEVFGESDSVCVSVIGATSGFLGEFLLDDADSQTGRFFGVASAEAIASVDVNGAASCAGSGSFEAVDDVATSSGPFVEDPSSGAAEVPLGPEGALLLAALLGLFGLWQLRARVS